MNCPNCGAAIEPGQIKCFKCGTAVQQSQSQPAGFFSQPIPVAETQKSWIVTLVLCFFVGYLGIHRFYTGSIVIGIIQLCTGGFCGVWTLVDFILILTGAYRDGNGQKLVKK